MAVVTKLDRVFWAILVFWRFSRCLGIGGGSPTLSVTVCFKEHGAPLRMTAGDFVEPLGNR